MLTPAVVGDNVTDDTAALQAWLNAGGGELPPGYFKVTSPLQVTGNTMIAGCGKLRSCFMPAGPFTTLAIATGGSQCVQVRDCSFNYIAGTTPADVYAITRTTTADQAIFDSYSGIYFTGAGMSFDRSVLPTVHDCYFGQIAGHGLSFTNTYMPDNGDPNVSCCTFVQIGGDCIFYTGGGGMKIVNMKVSYAKIGVGLAFDKTSPTGDLQISNSSMEGISLAAVYLSSVGTTWLNVGVCNCEFESEWGVITPLGATNQWLNNVVLSDNIWVGGSGMYSLDGIVNLSIIGGVAHSTNIGAGATKVHLGPMVSNGVVGLIAQGHGKFAPSVNLGQNITTINPW